MEHVHIEFAKACVCMEGVYLRDGSLPEYF